MNKLQSVNLFFDYVKTTNELNNFIKIKDIELKTKKIKQFISHRI